MVTSDRKMLEVVISDGKMAGRGGRIAFFDITGVCRGRASVTHGVSPGGAGRGVALGMPWSGLVVLAVLFLWTVLPGRTRT
jgi:hypothetical protein